VNNALLLVTAFFPQTTSSWNYLLASLAARIPALHHYRDFENLSALVQIKYSIYST
jgi:hypothetical protein